MRMIVGLDRPPGYRHVWGRRYHDLETAANRGRAARGRRCTRIGRRAHLRWIARNRLPVKRVDEVLGLVGLADVAGKRAGTFSLGMAQRLGIAGGAAWDPPVLLLDEPVNGLDPEGIRWIRTLMRTLASEGRTVFVSSHLLAEMAHTADRLVVIGRGRLMADTTMADFLTVPASIRYGFGHHRSSACTSCWPPRS